RRAYRPRRAVARRFLASMALPRWSVSREQLTIVAGGVAATQAKGPAAPRPRHLPTPSARTSAVTPCGSYRTPPVPAGLCSGSSLVARSPDLATAPTEGLLSRAAPETCGQLTWHGPETRPQLGRQATTGGLALHDVGHPLDQRRGDGPAARRHLVH